MTCEGCGRHMRPDEGVELDEAAFAQLMQQKTSHHQARAGEPPRMACAAPRMAGRAGGQARRARPETSEQPGVSSEQPGVDRGSRMGP